MKVNNNVGLYFAYHVGKEREWVTRVKFMGEYVFIYIVHGRVFILAIYIVCSLKNSMKGSRRNCEEK